MKYHVERYEPPSTDEEDVRCQAAVYIQSKSERTSRCRLKAAWLVREQAWSPERPSRRLCHLHAQKVVNDAGEPDVHGDADFRRRLKEHRRWRQVRAAGALE